MNRRNFLQCGVGAGISGLALAGVAVAGSRQVPAPGQVPVGGLFRLWHVADRSIDSILVPRVRVHLERFVAAPIPVLAHFRMQALFTVAGASNPVPFHAWSYREACCYGNSSGASFTAPAAGVRGLWLEYALKNSDVPTCQERCATTHLLRPRWRPGRYVLAGPRVDGRAADHHWRQDAADHTRLLRLDGSLVDFDYLSLRIEAEAT